MRNQLIISLACLSVCTYAGCTKEGKSLFIRYYHAGLEVIEVKDGELVHSWHTLKDEMVHVQSLDAYDPHVFRTALTANHVEVFKEWVNIRKILSLPSSYKTVDPNSYSAAFHSNFEIHIDGIRHKIGWNGSSDESTDRIRRAISELRSICLEIRKEKVR